MSYENAGQFDRAVKDAIRKSGKNPGNAYREMLRDRFLCRVFSEDDHLFVLKGGSNLLARIPDSRATKDIDFAITSKETSESVLQALNELVSKDLGDFCTFRLTSSKETLDENGYSRLLKLRYASYIGDEEKDPILIDLSLGCVITQSPELISPANRVEIKGIKIFDYVAYPLVDQIADKLCAIMELQPNGYPSSRMKDLVDVVTYVTNKRFILSELRRAIESECAKRNMTIPVKFSAPDYWKNRFSGFAEKNGICLEYRSFELAEELASRFFNPALSDDRDNDAEWDAKSKFWRML